MKRNPLPATPCPVCAMRDTAPRETRPDDEEVRALCARYPQHVRWLERADGRVELRLADVRGGYIYDFDTRRWNHCDTMRLISGSERRIFAAKPAWAAHASVKP